MKAKQKKRKETDNIKRLMQKKDTGQGKGTRRKDNPTGFNKETGFREKTVENRQYKKDNEKNKEQETKSSRTKHKHKTRTHN